MTVVTRFAPSPTGSLHVGGARTALFCLLHARKHDGRFLLRIEDTDRARSTEESTRGILRDLEWLGLLWDEGPGKDLGRGPYFQSQRLDRYTALLEELQERGVVYEAWDSREELMSMRAEAQAEKRDFRYRQRQVSPDQVAAYKAEGRVPVLRLKAPDHDVHVHDEVLGQVTVTVDHLEDIVVRKADGFPTYHFAVVVDDHDMLVSQIMRGQEHLMNTPKHLGLMEVLGWEPPKFGHLPLIFNPDNSKMSKRDKAKAARAAMRAAKTERGAGDWAWLAEDSGVPVESLERFAKKKSDDIPTAEAIAACLDVELPMIEVLDFWKGGFVPEAVVNYLALLGWNPGAEADGTEREIFSLDELIERWDLGRIGKTNAKFDVTKLRWMNGEHLRNAPWEVVSQHLNRWFEVVTSPLQQLPEPKLREIFELFAPRVHTFVELEQATGWLRTAPNEYDSKAVKKWLLKGGGADNLQAVRAVIASADWTLDGLEAAVKGFAETRGVGLGKVAQPLRVAISGSAATPGLWECLGLLERDDVLARIDRLLRHLAAL